MSDPPTPRVTHPARVKARKAGIITTTLIILTYAGLCRWAFAEPFMGNSGGVVSLSFIFSVPFACGALSVAIARWCGSDNWVLYSILTPTLIMIVGLTICVITGIEAIICVIMAAPILLIATILGGLLAHALLPKNQPQNHLYATLAVFLPFLPFLTAYAESTLHWPTETKAITNTLIIQATPEQIWPLIASVEAIAPEQIPNKWIYLIGFPKPIAATLDKHAVGGIRTATFQRDVSFFEEITHWEKPQKLSFSIHADPDFIPRTAFDQHIIVGGRFYDVLDGTYQILPLTETHSRLILTSNHRLSTRFNSYAAWWSVQVMDQIQGSILDVIKTRAEETGL